MMIFVFIVKNINLQLLIINLNYSSMDGHSGNGNRGTGVKGILIVNLEQVLLYGSLNWKDFVLVSQSADVGEV